MPDRYDPKLSPGGGDRKGSSAQAAANDDPLAELAKIVSGRTSGSRGRAAPVAHDPIAAGTGADVLGDLENELLNDLQASFATVREMVNGDGSPPRPASPQVQPVPPPVQTTPAAQPQTMRAAAPPPVEPPSIDQADFDILAAGLAERLAPQVAQPVAAPPPTGRPRTTAQPEPRLEALPPRGASPSSEPRFLSDTVPERVERTRAERGAEATDFGGFRQRAVEPSPRAVEPPPSAGAKGPRTRWDKPESHESKFAPPKAQAVKAQAFDDDDLDSYVDLLPTEDDGAADFPLDGFGDLPAEADDLDAGYMDDPASLARPRRSRAPVVVAAVVGLVVVGGVAFALFRPGGIDVTGEPPVIVADGAPTKITPDQPATTDAEGSNKLIYDRVSPADGAETTVLATEEQPIAEMPGSSASDNAITRVIIPGGPGIDPPSDEGLSLDGQPSTMDAADGSAPDVLAANGPADPGSTIGPRKVRTVIVKPDGTIVESAATEAGAEPAAIGQPATGPTPAPAQAVPPPSEPAPVTDDTAAITGGNANGELAITPSPETAAVMSPQAAEAAAPPAPTAAPAPVATPAPAPEPVVAATQNPTPADVGQSAPVPAGGVLVQVSSQRTEDAARATFRDLQARYPNILGPYDVNIQRADIPDRGTFFRVRVGPFSASDAQRLCNDLKAAGGDCILAQR